MPTQTIEEYNENKYRGMFILPNDGDSAEVVLLYRSRKDVLAGDAHYIKSDDYSGYVDCLGKGCPACAKGLRKQAKLFIPLYVLSSDEVLFWDRSIKFYTKVLDPDVFSRYPNPSEFIFEIVRDGEPNDINTRYNISARYKNSTLTYDKILADKGISLPDFYSTVCKTFTASELEDILSPHGYVSDEQIESMPEYKLTPRAVVRSQEEEELPELEDIASGNDDEVDTVSF